MLVIAFLSLFSQEAPVGPSLLDRMRTTTWRAGCPVAPEELRQVTIKYWTFDRKATTGILVTHQDVAEEVSAIFQDLFRRKFLIGRIAPVEEYNGNDDASMAANN